MKDNSIPKEEKENCLLDTVNFHDLRHTNTTLLIALGTAVTTVAGRLGHKETSTTMNIYSHFLQKADRSAVDKLEDLFRNDISNKKQG